MQKSNPPHAPIRFRNCEICPDSRTLVVEGAVQSLPAKAFDLLLLLLRERHRVVGKEAIAEAVWRRWDVSDGVIARTVMLVRRALRDTAAVPVAIKTVRGIGYQFIAPLQRAGPAERALQAEAAATPPLRRRAADNDGRPRIGVLPIVNASGDAALDWIRTGLTALVAESLAADGALDVVPTVRMLLVAQAEKPAAAGEENVVQALSLNLAVAATVRKGHDALKLDYRLWGPQRQAQAGSLRAADILALGQQLVARIRQALAPGAGGAGGAGLQVSADLFINQAYSRGLELMAHLELQAARHHFEVVCHAEPRSLPARRALVQCLVSRLDERAPDEATTLLDLAAAAGDIDSVAFAHGALATWHMIKEGPQHAPIGEQHAQAVLALARQHALGAWLGRFFCNLGSRRAEARRWDEAQECFARSEAVFREHGDDEARLTLLRVQAWQEEIRGELPQAAAHLAQSLQGYRSRRQPLLELRTLSQLVVVEAKRGRLDTGYRWADELQAQWDHIHPREHTEGVAALLLAQAFLCFERLDAGRLQRLSASAGARLTRSATDGPRLALEAVLALSQGDLERALARLGQAIERAAQAPGPAFGWHWYWKPVQLRIAVARRDPRQLDDIVRSASDWLEQHVDHELRACLAHVQADAALRRGSAETAADILERAVAQTPSGREAACARLDLAWLRLEQGRLEPVQALLQPLEDWRTQHPVGLAVQARWHHELGARAEAVATQRRALALHGGARVPPHERLLEDYRQGRAISPGRLGGLASSSWLPRADLVSRAEHDLSTT